MDRRSFLAVSTAAAAVAVIPAAAAPAWVPGVITPRGRRGPCDPIACLVRGCWGLQEVDDGEGGTFWKLHHGGTGYIAASGDDRETMEAFADMLEQVGDFSKYSEDEMPGPDVVERVRHAITHNGFIRISGHYYTR